MHAGKNKNKKGEIERPYGRSSISYETAELIPITKVQRETMKERRGKRIRMKRSGKSFHDYSFGASND